MTIEELLDLYYTQGESVCSENSTAWRILPQNIILKNRRFAREELMKKSKEELVEFLLTPPDLKC